MKKLFLSLLVLVSLPLCLFPAGLAESCASDPFFTESYACGEAALMLCINADAYSDPAPTVGEILGGLSPHTPLTRVEGCRMILRAFGPLPDVQEGIRYLVKYRDCAFDDVPWYGEAAVRNLTDAGLYIPDDNTVFGPYELMTEHELFLLVDRIHAYLQSSPRDDFYSWATADLVNDPGFLPVEYYLAGGADNTLDTGAFSGWIIDMLNDCLENPDTPEKANIAAYMSTYMDMEGRENSMEFIQPMVDAIWNAPDFDGLMDVCADICRETGIELLLNGTLWHDGEENFIRFDNDTCAVYYKYGFFTGQYTADDYIPESYHYQAFLEQKTRLFSLLGLEKEETGNALRNFLEGFMYAGFALYDSFSDEDKAGYAGFNAEEAAADMPDTHLAGYLERAGYGNNYVAIDDYAEVETVFTLMRIPENLPGVKAAMINSLIGNLLTVCPLEIVDAYYGFWEAYYATDPSSIFMLSEITTAIIPLIQIDADLYFSKTEEYVQWHDRLAALCDDIKAYYRGMLENATWLGEESRQAAISKLDSMRVELLTPSDYSGLLHVDYISAEDGGTLLENVTRFLKARREWLYRLDSLKDSRFAWAIFDTWVASCFYSPEGNTFYLCAGFFVANHVMEDPSYEALLSYIGFTIAHEISHGFDRSSSGDIWTPEDKEEFETRCAVFAEYLGGWEFMPGFAVEDGYRILDECVADLTAMKCLMGIASEKPGFDYAHFFRTLALEYAFSCTRSFAFLYVEDEHATGRARLNPILSMTDEFYTTFDVHEGDAMYVAPKDRPYVW